MFAIEHKSKKNPQTKGCGFNPIQGELEETGVTIMRCVITVLFILVIRDIQYGNKAIAICPLSDEQADNSLFTPVFRLGWLGLWTRYYTQQ